MANASRDDHRLKALAVMPKLVDDNISQSIKVRRFKQVTWLLGQTAMLFILFATRAVTRLKIQGVKNLPRHGPYLVIANHESDFDHAIMLTLMTRRFISPSHIFIVADKSRFFGTRFSRLVSTLLHLIPIQRNRSIPTKDLLRCAQVINRGDILLAYPHGTRNSQGSRAKFRHGIAIIICLLGQCTVVPVKLDGTADVLPYNHWWPRLGRRTKATIGKPVVIRGYSPGNVTLGEIDEITENLWNLVASL